MNDDDTKDSDEHDGDEAFFGGSHGEDNSDADKEDENREKDRKNIFEKVPGSVVHVIVDGWSWGVFCPEPEGRVRPMTSGCVRDVPSPVIGCAIE